MININNIKKISLYDLNKVLHSKDISQHHKNKILELKVFHDISYNIFELDFPVSLLKRYVLENDELSSIDMCNFIGNNMKKLALTPAPNISVLDSLDLMTRQAFEDGNVALMI